MGHKYMTRVSNVDNYVEIGDFFCFFAMFLYKHVRLGVDKLVNRTLLTSKKLIRSIKAFSILFEIVLVTLWKIW